MALYWPDQKVALDIVDDPNRRPFEGDESYTVLRVTCADLVDYDSFNKISAHLCELLGKEVPSSPEWEHGNRMLHAMLMGSFTSGTAGPVGYPFPDLDEMFDWEDDPVPMPFDFDDGAMGEPPSVEILASSDEEAAYMRRTAKEHGQHVRGVALWEGPVPPGSFQDISPYTRMSTPEYFFYRKANELPLPEAVRLGVELCGKYRTQITQHTRGPKEYDVIRSPRTTRADIRRYLRGARGTKEGKRAKRVLRLVSDECSSPMGCYLYMMVCLPRAQGGYGIDRAVLSGAFRGRKGFMPASVGHYLAYDLCWPDRHIALQYTGKKKPSERQRAALCVEGMQVVCVTDEDVADPERLDKAVRELARLGGLLIPDPTDAWLEARDRLRNQIEVPTYRHMRLTADEMLEHLTE